MLYVRKCILNLKNKYYLRMYYLTWKIESYFAQRYRWPNRHSRLGRARRSLGKEKKEKKYLKEKQLQLSWEKKWSCFDIISMRHDEQRFVQRKLSVLFILKRNLSPVFGLKTFHSRHFFCSLSDLPKWHWAWERWFF